MRLEEKDFNQELGITETPEANVQVRNNL